MRPLTSLPAVTIGVIALCSGCAARTAQSSACEPVPDDFALAGQIVYAECAVDKKARLSTTLPHLDYTPSRGRACVRAAIVVVVDSTGQPVQETARVVRSTDPALGLAVLNSLGDLRYDPALKDGRPVPQLVRVDRMVQTMMIAVPVGTLPSSVRPPRRPAPC